MTMQALKARCAGAKVRGTALVLVLWIVVGLSLTVVAGTRAISAHARLAAIELDRQRAEAILDGAIAVLSQYLRADGNAGKRYKVYELTMGGEQVIVEVTPSKGLIDFNVASDELVQGLLREIGGMPAGEALVMGSRIRDWIDPDDQPSGVGGAEAAQYRSAGWPSLPRNAAMEDGSELLSVLGMTPEIYEKLRPFIGINGGQRLDIGSAPSMLVDHLTGRAGVGAQIHASPPEQLEAVVSPFISMPYFNSRPSDPDRTLRLVATLTSASGLKWQRLVWIDRAERPDTLTPWTTLVVDPTRRSVVAQQE
jgi:general secretion pathway protein K